MTQRPSKTGMARKIAIACQGGGIHGAFGYGVLDAILSEAGRVEPRGSTAAPFEIIALSGTSSGALNAFMVWYGLLSRPQAPFDNARAVLKRLWDTFQVQKSGEWSLNSFAQFLYRWQELGLHLRSPAPPLTHEWLTLPALRTWSAVEKVLAPNGDLGEIRPEFYEFRKLLQACAPEFPTLTGWETASPRLVVGAVEILSGTFEVFDSHDTRRGAEARSISYEAVEASGTLPEVRPAQSIPGLKNRYGQDCLYWDGLFSQNPPVRELIADTPLYEIPDELWVIRINPQRRERPPVSAGEIDDRWNELSGNLSLNQELYFIDKVNQWIEQGRFAHGQAGDKQDESIQEKKLIDLYMIAMAPDMASLGVATKFDRNPLHIGRLREHGLERGRAFLRARDAGTARKWRYQTPLDALE